MNRFMLMLLPLIVLGCTSKSSYDPDERLTPQQKDEIMDKTIRYIVKAPEKIQEADKFNSKHDQYYQQRASECRLELYCVAGDNHFFLISQPAPSLTLKKHATGGKFKLDAEGNIIEYEEIFRTWKMQPDTLKKRSYVLFDKMVAGEPLDSYHTKYSKGIEYIEFPDDRTYYDKQQRSWKIKAE
jgi:hypothetical protein